MNYAAKIFQKSWELDVVSQDARDIHISQVGPLEMVLYSVELKPLLKDKILEYDI